MGLIKQWRAKVGLFLGAPALIFLVTAYGMFKPDKAATPVFALPVPPGKSDLLRGETATLALSVHNKLTRESLDLSGYECKPNITPDGVPVEPSKDKNCAFTLKNIGLANDGQQWPVRVDFSLAITEPSATTRSPLATVNFHDISPPTINRASFVWNKDNLTVAPTITKNRETTTQVTRCEWRPADLFVRPVIEGPTPCIASFRKIPSEPLPAISVVVTFLSADGKLFSAPATEDVPVYIPPLAPAGASDTSHTAQAAVAAPPDAVAPAQTNSAKVLPARMAVTRPSGGAPSVAGASPASLVSSLQGRRDDDRYDRLALGLRALAPNERISPDEGVALLGPLTGTLRVSGLSLLLPFLHTPLTSEDAATLLEGLSSSDRADTLHALAGCLSQPPDKTALLAGIYGADRPWVETALSVSGPCTLASRTAG